MEKLFLGMLVIVMFASTLHAKRDNPFMPVSDTSMKDVSADAPLFNNKAGYKDKPEYINTKCPAHTYVYKTPYLEFELPEGFEVRSFVGYSGHSYTRAVIALKKYPNEILEPCEEDCVHRRYTIYIHVHAYTYANGTYQVLSWPHEEVDMHSSSKAPDEPRYLRKPVSIRKRSGPKTSISTETVHADRTTLMMKLKLETNEILFADGLEVSMYMSSDEGWYKTPEFAKRQDCLLDKIIETIRAK